MTNNEPAVPPPAPGPEEEKKPWPFSFWVGRDVKGHIIVGNNNQVYESQIFNFLAPAIVIGIVLLVALGLWYRQVQNGRYDLNPMAGSLNVAIVRFADWTDGKCGVRADSGLLLANAFYSRLKSDGTLEELQRVSNLEMELRPPEELYPLQGRDEAGLVQAVEKLADRINAHIVVYGVLECSEVTGNASYRLMFYVSPSSFSDAQELIGQFSFGADVLHGEVSPGSEFLELNKNLQQKIEVLSLLIKAIGSFWGEDYPRSLGYLATARESSLWQSESGQEVIEIIAGNCESKYAQSLLVNEQEQEAVAAIERARSDYLSADELTQADGRGKYARSYIGLAGVEGFYKLKKTLLSNNLQDLDLAALVREQALLSAAQEATYRPLTSDIPEKVAFGQAQIDLLRYELKQDAVHLDSARRNYQAVIDAYHRGNLRLREMAGHSHAGLAILERIGGDRAAALQDYQQAVRITRIPSLQAQYLYQIGNTYYADQDFKNALVYFQEAWKHKQDLENRVPQSTIDDLERKIEACEAEASP
jgi:tetratricopeptide (TPR) repeat protein